MALINDIKMYNTMIQTTNDHLEEVIVLGMSKGILDACYIVKRLVSRLKSGENNPGPLAYKTQNIISTLKNIKTFYMSFAKIQLELS